MERSRQQARLDLTETSTLETKLKKGCPVPALQSIKVPCNALFDSSALPQIPPNATIHVDAATSLAYHVLLKHLSSGFLFGPSFVPNGADLLQSMRASWGFVTSDFGIRFAQRSGTFSLAAGMGTDFELTAPNFASNYPHLQDTIISRLVLSALNAFSRENEGSHVGVLLFTKKLRQSLCFTTSVLSAVAGEFVALWLPVVWNGFHGNGSIFYGISACIRDRDAFSVPKQTEVNVMAKETSAVKKHEDYQETSQPSQILTQNNSVAQSMGDAVLLLKPPPKPCRQKWLTMVKDAWSKIGHMLQKGHKDMKQGRYDKPWNPKARQDAWARIEEFERTNMTDEDLAYAWLELLGHGPWENDRLDRLRAHDFMRLVDFGSLVNNYINGVTKEWQRKRDYLVKLSRGHQPANFKHQSRILSKSTQKKSHPLRGIKMAKLKNTRHRKDLQASQDIDNHSQPSLPQYDSSELSLHPKYTACPNSDLPPFAQDLTCSRRDPYAPSSALSGYQKRPLHLSKNESTAGLSTGSVTNDSTARNEHRKSPTTSGDILWEQLCSQAALARSLRSPDPEFAN